PAGRASRWSPPEGRESPEAGERRRPAIARTSTWSREGRRRWRRPSPPGQALAGEPAREGFRRPGRCQRAPRPVAALRSIPPYRNPFPHPGERAPPLSAPPKWGKEKLTPPAGGSYTEGFRRFRSRAVNQTVADSGGRERV